MKHLLHKFIHFAILPCNEATFMIEKQLHSKLSLKEQLQLKAHLHLCKICLNYSKKAFAIHQWLQKFFLSKEEHSPIKTAEMEQFKKDLKKRLHTQS